MRIKQDQKNLKYTLCPGSSFRGPEEFEIDRKNMIIISVDKQAAKKIKINLKINFGGTNAYIKALTSQGEETLNTIIENKQFFVGKSYEEMLNIDVVKQFSYEKSI